jgi:DNA-binding FadR family transcriptional regulator
VLLWHQKIVDAIAEGDADAASEAMVYVILNGMRRHEGTAIETAGMDPLSSANTGE